MYWDFRVLRKKVFSRELLEVHRVFYADEAKSQLLSIELQPYSVVGTDPNLILRDILDVTAAFSKPSLRAEHIDIGSNEPIV